MTPFKFSGEGVRFVGDNISNFSAGELLLLGANLPHMWRCNEKYFRGTPSITAEAIVVHFLPEFMGNDFLKKPETASILNLYEKAKSGIEIHGDTKKEVVAHMRQSVKKEGLGRMVSIINIIEILAESKEIQPITTSVTSYKSNQKEIDRLNKIYVYTLENYHTNLTLEEIAAVANLSVTSFCRYFKMMTKKTFHDFLIEIRISHARRMLIEETTTTTEAICFECGFNNRSNFFRHFRQITGFSPVEYKHKYLAAFGQ